MANLKLIDELLEKTEYIYVLGIDGKPQMPTNRKVRVRSLFKSGLAKIVDTVPFTIRLLYENNAVLQPITLAEDPGRTNIGAAVLTQLGDLVFSAAVETRNKDIKKLMTDRKVHRQASRRGERKARQRLARRHGSMIKAGMLMRKLPQYAVDKFVTCKFIKNTEARFCNRKRIPDWLTPTVNHIVQTHINLIKKVEGYLPITDIAIEVNRFAFMQMENPEASGVDFQNGPLKGYGALSTLNQAIPFICERLIKVYGKDHVHFCTGKDTSLIRTSFGCEKTKDNQMHEVDAYCIGFASLGIDIKRLPKFNHVYKIKQFRRQDRSIINYQRERTYYLDGKKIATNRKPRFEQKGDALSDWYSEQVKLKGKAYADKQTGHITVKKSIRSYNSRNRVAPGAIFYYNGKRLVLTGQLTGGKYYRAYGDTKTNYPVNKCQIYKHNEGLVFV